MVFSGIKMQFFRGVGQSGAGLTPRARWIIGCNDIFCPPLRYRREPPALCFILIISSTTIYFIHHNIFHPRRIRIGGAAVPAASTTRVDFSASLSQRATGSLLHSNYFIHHNLFHPPQHFSSPPYSNRRGGCASRIDHKGRFLRFAIAESHRLSASYIS